ncbi:hypothetical protein ACN27F_00080 [Solwaraspora sp. WMMB335]|uniref:hypothetical protein n=1 Tax=Solwaraspora sp. WMMB335 TaxID=3404118 RepID=UPI003B95FBE9
MAEPSITYDVGKFHRKLLEVRSCFAELRYIDTAMAYLEDEKARWWHSAPIGPGTFNIEIQFGTTFPFRKIYQVPAGYFRIPWHDSEREEVESRLRALAGEANAWAATEIDAVATRVRPFTWPIGSLYEIGCVEPVLAVHDTLADEVSADFGKLGHSLGSWEGDAADNFATSFYHPFEHTLRNQKQLLTALAGGVAAAQAIAESTQRSLMNVVHYTWEAVREQLQLCQSRAELARQESTRSILVIAGGTATVFGAIVSGGSLWAAGAGAVAGGAGIASTAIPDGGWAALDLYGATATDLLTSMSDAIGQVVHNDSVQHEALRKEVQHALERVRTLRSGGSNDGRLIPIRPNLVSGVDGDDFYLP